MTSAELRAERKRLIDEQRRILEPCVTEKRAMTGEERERVETLDKAIDELAATIERVEKLDTTERSYVPESQRTTTAVAETAAADRAAQYRDAFWRAMRQGVGPDELRVLTVGTDTQGGYTVPDEFRRTIIQALDEFNVVREYATVIPSMSGTLTIPVLSGHASAAYGTENSAYAESTPTFTEVTFSAHKQKVLIKISEELMNDSAFPMEQFIASEMGRALAELEETAFVTGTGSNEPTGLTVGSALGKTATATNAVTADELVDLYHSLPRPYRARAIWLMKDSTIQAIRKLVTGVSGDKTYLWQPGLANGEPDRLLGRPVVPCADMPAIATGNKAIIWGDLSYYWIVERQSMTMQRLVELYAANGLIGFRIFRRHDAKVTLNDAIKHLILA